MEQPLLVKQITIDNSVIVQYLFPGNAPPSVVKCLKDTIYKYNAGSTIQQVPQLQSFYGPKWRLKCGFEPVLYDLKNVNGGDVDIPDDLIGDIFETDVPDIKQELFQKSETKPQTYVDIPPIELMDIAVYPEDRISELKLKLYTATNIPIYYQHLFYIYRNSTIPLAYNLYLHDVSKPIDIVDANKVSSNNILGFPIDHDIFPNKNDLSIINYDSTKTVDEILRSDYNICYLISLEPMIMQNLDVLQELVKSDKIQIELLYYGFIVLYFPMISYSVFEQLLTTVEIKSIYPDLVPSVGKLRTQYAAEAEILTLRNQLLNTNDPKFAKFSPTGTTHPGNAINIHVKSAILKVQTISETLSNRIQLDPQRLFDTIVPSSDIPIIRANLYINRKSIILTRLDNTPNIQKVYDSVRYRMRLPTAGTVLFVVKHENYYIVVVINTDGNYSVRLSWEDETVITFGNMYKEIQNSVNNFIERINQYGRRIFNSSTRLPLVKASNSQFSDLSINMFWYKSLNEKDYYKMERSFDLDLRAGIFAPLVVDEHVPNTLGFVMMKNMIDMDPATQDDLGSNQYSYYQDSRYKTRWLASIGSGRPITISRRTTDVRIELTNMSENEFKYFYQYFVCRLYTISEGFNQNDQFKPKLVPILEKNRLKILKERDPRLYKFKRFGSNIVYSRICQKQHQPEIYYPNEFDILPAVKKSKAVRYWNFTTESPMYYVCPNPIYPALSFIVGQHPKNYCLPCCKKTMVQYEYALDVGTKKVNIYNTCINSHEYIETDTTTVGSRYIMTYGKALDIGRISYLPPLLDKYLLYNLTEDPIEEMGTVPMEQDGTVTHYSVDILWKLSKNNKIRNVAIDTLDNLLNIPSWNYQTTYNPNQIQYSPQEILDNPHVSATHYNRISNADCSYPILIYRNLNDGWQSILDGLHRLAKAKLQGIPTIPVRYITRRQLLKARHDDTDNTRKTIATEIVKKPGYYIFGVPQNSTNIDNIGALYAVATALGLGIVEFIQATVKQIPNVFHRLLNGTISKYFADPQSLIATIQRINSTNIELGHFEFQSWNELFMDLARYCYGKYCIVFDDRQVEISGTSIKQTYDDIQLILPSHIQESFEIIPPTSEDHPITREYILLLRKRKRSKNILTNDYYYYPIFVFIPHEFFKTLEIKKRIFMQEDTIIKSIKVLIESCLTETNKTRNEISLHVMEQYIEHVKKKIDMLYINANDKCYAIAFDNLLIPVNASDYKHLSLPLTRGLCSRVVKQTYQEMKSFMQMYNDWIVKLSEQAGLIKIVPSDSESLSPNESLILPIYPLMKIQSLIVFDKNIIGYATAGLYYWFKSLPQKALPTVVKYYKQKYNVIESQQIITLYYDPDQINKNIWDFKQAGWTKSTSGPLQAILPSAKYTVGLYKLLQVVIMDRLDLERDNNLRGKIKKIIVSNNPNHIRGAIVKLLQYESDVASADVLLNQYIQSMDKKSLIEQFDDSIFRFDRTTLNHFRTISENYLTQPDSAQASIHKALVAAVTKICSNVTSIISAKDVKLIKTHDNYYHKDKLRIQADRLKILIDIFASDLVNPLKREYLLSGIFNAGTGLNLNLASTERLYLELS